jgi:hypothetical protein
MGLWTMNFTKYDEIVKVVKAENMTRRMPERVAFHAMKAKRE